MVWWGWVGFGVECVGWVGVVFGGVVGWFVGVVFCEEVEGGFVDLGKGLVGGWVVCFGVVGVGVGFGGGLGELGWRLSRGVVYRSRM